MADDFPQNDPTGHVFDFNDGLDLLALESAIDGLHSHDVSGQYESPLIGFGDQFTVDPSFNVSGTPTSGVYSDGSVSSNLATRSNTPGSDSGLHSSSPGIGNVQSNGNPYRSRLPRRRSLYSRQRPVLRQPSFLTNINEPLWTPDNHQAIDSSNRPLDLTTPFNPGPLRRSNSSTSVNSECSNSSAYSTASASSATSAGAHSNSSHRRSRKHPTTSTSSSSSSKKPNPDPRPFKCTFCCDAFKSKYDWRRHEKSLHLDLEAWNCAPASGTLPSPTGPLCAYCSAPSPSPPHLETHNHAPCATRPPPSRSFRRRDHLAQHLRVFHKLPALPPSLTPFHSPSPPITSRCGFCDARLASWEARADHLAAHFRQGCSMRDWSGGHGFAEDVEARVTNALPPYYIATEAASLVPFTATSAGARDHFKQIRARTERAPLEAGEGDGARGAEGETAALRDSRAMTASAFADVLAAHLARFARERFGVGGDGAGGVVSDEALQREARLVLYSSDDPWNQTIADSPVWLREWRERFGVGGV